MQLSKRIMTMLVVLLGGVATTWSAPMQYTVIDFGTRNELRTIGPGGSVAGAMLINPAPHEDSQDDPHAALFVGAALSRRVSTPTIIGDLPDGQPTQRFGSRGSGAFGIYAGMVVGWSSG
jgi:hypothetical protein